MKYDRIDNKLYMNNRVKFALKMEQKSLAVFNSNDIYPISADSTMPFQQHRDILYLSGVDQEESILVIFPSCSNQKHREILFLKETDEHIAVWEGEKLDKKAAFEVSGIQTVYWLEQFPIIFKQLMVEAESIYLNTNEHLRANTEVQTREDRFIEFIKKEYPAHLVRKSAPFMHSLRSVKDKIEIDLMQRACNITEAGFRRILKFIKPGVWEYEINDLQPIKLSKEVLESCVFNFKKLGFNYSVSHGITSDNFHFVLNDNYYIKIEYLHELQNIYFDFCKTELKFKKK